MGQYFEEKYASRIIESDDHFIIYDSFDDGSIYVRHMYVSPRSRSKSRAKEIEASVIQKEAAKSIWFDIDRTSDRWEQVLMFFTRCGGYIIDSVKEDKIILYRNVQDE